MAKAQASRKKNASWGVVNVARAELSGSFFNRSNTAFFTYASPSNLWVSQVTLQIVGYNNNFRLKVVSEPHEVQK